MSSFPLTSEAYTKQLAQAVAPLLQPVDCLTLTGTLGAGKTTFMRYLIQALSPETDCVISPSFMLMQEYPIVALRALGGLPPQTPAASRRPLGGDSSSHSSHDTPLATHHSSLTTLLHVDGYRLNSPDEIPELGLEERFETCMVAIEWPEIFASLLPPDRLELTLTLLPDGTRQAHLQGRGKHARSIAEISKAFHASTL